eukprot:8723227-Pyramimonas_sp.AAC.1
MMLQASITIVSAVIDVAMIPRPPELSTRTEVPARRVGRLRASLRAVARPRCAKQRETVIVIVAARGFVNQFAGGRVV